jgi:hypothetical protein
LKKGRCKGNDVTERENQGSRSDRAGERPQAEGMEERGQGGMKYLVVVRYILRGTAWKTIQREFNNKEAAEAYAREMYAGEADELCVCVYELIECMN